jgi:hypothetical protein
MRKLINNPDDFVDEVLEGILAAHPDQLRSASADNRAIVRADSPTDGRVGIVTYPCSSGTSARGSAPELRSGTSSRPPHPSRSTPRR